MRTQVGRGRREEDGVYAVMFVLLLGVFIMAGALAVDMGQLYFARHATKAVADMAATAGGLALEPTAGGTPRDGCLDAWAYTVTNLPDAPNSAPDPCGGMPVSADACSPTSPPTTVTGTVTAANGDPLYRISVTWPVADTDPTMDARLTETIDGTQCQRIGVTIQRFNDMLLAGFAGPDQFSVSSSSIARAQTSETGGDLVALAVLHRTDCRSLTTSGQGNVKVKAAQITDDDGNLIWVPGAITVDSDGTTDCSANPRYAIAPSGGNVNSYIIAENAPGGAPGVVLSHAQLVNPTRSADPTKCGPNGSPTDTRPLQPCPVGGNRVTRAPIDHRYNCKASYPTGLGIPACSDAASGGAHIDELQARLGGVGVTPPAGFQVYPRAGEPGDTCNINNTVTINLPAGNWFINCPNTGGSGNSPGFRMNDGGARFTIDAGEVVFAGWVEIANGEFTVGSPSAQSIVYVRPYQNVVNDGRGRITQGNGTINLINTFVYLENGYFRAGAGDAPLKWIAPDDTSFPFDDLAFWSDNIQEHAIGGQGNLEMEGTFFMPNARFTYKGQGTQQQARAQFISSKLTFDGQGALEMTPDPDRSTPIPIQGVRLIR
jgi:hypothetical protein